MGIRTEETVEVRNDKKYRDDLVKQIKDAGQELINRAEEMVDEETDLITDFNINIHFPQGEFASIPEISWTTEVACKRTFDRLFGSVDGSQEKHMV